MPVFKVWSCVRSKRLCVVSECTVDGVRDTVSIKLGINGTHVCLESDGTIIDSDEILEHFSKEISILLQNFESWTPIVSNSCDKDDLNRNDSIDHEIHEFNKNKGNIDHGIENTENDAHRTLDLDDHFPRIDPVGIENTEDTRNNANRSCPKSHFADEKD